MMSLALKAFPGMVMSMLLAAPAFAATDAAHHGRTTDRAAPRRTAHADEHRRTGLSASLPMISRAGGRVTAATRGRRGGRGNAVTTAFINDATAWSEPGASFGGASVYGGGEGGGRVIQVGMASWYGGRQWQGRRMSSGERYNEAELTAAHATLPLGSRALVSLSGGARSVVVRITDRPGTRRRIIDLSRAAAAELGILDRGIAEVAVTPL